VKFLEILSLGILLLGQGLEKVVDDFDQREKPSNNLN
jgi:hypothetical protein